MQINKTLHAMIPLVSVIIPTYGRPQYLPRAVESALAGMSLGEIEVIVVPNGPDKSWRESLAKYNGVPNVRVLPIEVAHANVARNFGLSQARGKHVRFLDDDDFLIQPNAMEQVKAQEESGAEISTGLVLNVDNDLSCLGIVSFPQTNDFIEAVFTRSGFHLPIANVFLREALLASGARWRNDVSRLQDLIWMLDLGSLREWRWQCFNKTVGAWFQHDGNRTSTVKLRYDKPTQAIDSLFNLYRKLETAGRLTEERIQALSSLLWDYIHWRFPYDVTYWTKVAIDTLKIAPGSRPEHPIFDTLLFRYMNPILAELSMALPRKITTWQRDMKRNLTGWDYRRRL